jgi:hypothetical protein
MKHTHTHAHTHTHNRDAESGQADWHEDVAAERELMQEPASGEEREKAREKPERRDQDNGDPNIKVFGLYGQA